MVGNSIRQIERILTNADWTACNMKHERVRVDPVSKEPIESEVSESGFERRCLCDAQVRKRRLSCGHTNARNQLIDQCANIANSITPPSQPRLETLIEQLRRLDIEISLLDHQKGEAELRLAHAIKANESTHDSKREISQIEAKHFNLLGDLRRTGNSILELLQGLRLDYQD